MRFDGRVAIVTGAGGGLGRAHALELAKRGAKVVVNDLGGARDGTGSTLSAAEAVVAEITASGGEAMADGASVSDSAAVETMVEQALSRWGRVDVLVNNAGVLRDRTFAKGTLEDFRFVLDVHLMGSVICTRAVWDAMREQGYGRILMTTSSSGLFGNFGQSNYGAAKMGVVGLMQTLALEGAKHDIRVNALAPTAATRMTEDLPGLPLDQLQPERVTPAMVCLVCEQAPTRTILAAGAGSFEQVNITLTRGVHISDGPDMAERLFERLAEVAEREGEQVPASGAVQAVHELMKAQAAGR
ncbi:MAG: SDR family NAD(P)-dependent oxidoreductase [Brevundimonas sp.]|jgi:NAD(P)-dependent dehydrogenase (short-subunit alcohol dehydrogenase family)|uniref:SDR family NAD(P)-dependent oxidoreductase n=1 Tax=Brevundimonas sp. TaxID=1871086 RepID=UPI00391DDECB